MDTPIYDQLAAEYATRPAPTVVRPVLPKRTPRQALLTVRSTGFGWFGPTGQSAA
ncbi:hypothetical protein ACGFJC_47135 [Nonomuraea fuscirosea]|uniref:hypothetical protein n=1 Tax=Nonomuraea fuscirosea TaxID=1291556 RepID=UPI0037102FAD